MRLQHKITRAFVALLTAIAAIVTTVGATAVANAGTRYGAGYYFNAYVTPGGLVMLSSEADVLGVLGTYQGHPVYCREFRTVSDFAFSSGWTTTTDTNERIAAWMAYTQESHRNDDFIQAAVAYAIHDHIDRNPTGWADLKSGNNGLNGGDWNAVAARATSLWNEAASSMPASASASVAHTEGIRRGTIDPGIRNTAGNYVKGLPFTITLSGPAEFDSGGTTYSGTTSGSAMRIGWTATGTGSVKATVAYNDIRALVRNSEAQDVIGPVETHQSTTAVTFDVQGDFQPTVSTQVAAKELAAGQAVEDIVTSGIVEGDTWPKDTAITAHGYYFTGGSELLTTVEPEIEERSANSVDPSTYLRQLSERFGKPVATAQATFTGPNQRQTVSAHTDDGKPYINTQDGTFGTWYWTIAYDEQDESVQPYLRNFYNDIAGQPQETNVHPAQPVHESAVVEQHASIGTELMDTITVGGLPSDYGSFDGNNDYEFSPDASATIRVWWAGSGTGDRKQDEQYVPKTVDEPQEDAHHRIVGEWKVPARNGTYRVGGGTITLHEQNAKDAVTVADNVHIVARDASATGYYIFVYDFAGSSRAQAFTSAYNDPWERSFVEHTPTSVNLTSSVSRAQVSQGEQFHDTAHIHGTVPRGSYVVFSAYDAVQGNPDTSAQKLLDAARVNITDEQADASTTTAFDVVSPSIATDHTGHVYWQVQLYDGNDQPLATHELGIASETVDVRGVSVTSKVSAEQVYVNQPFFDTATISGAVSRGTYVVFDAYEPVEGDPNPQAAKLLNAARVAVSNEQADNSSWDSSFSVNSPKIHTTSAGRVYWQVTVYRADGLQLATHTLGIAGEDTTVLQPVIETQTSRTTVAPGESFTDTATITGTVSRGTYVTFDAYEPVDGEPNPQNAKLLDSARVVLSDKQADASATAPVSVTSPAVRTNYTGIVYWQAALHLADGTVIATHDLGLPSETVYVAPGGYLSSQAQPMGAVDTALYDTITVYNESVGHEGNGTGNPSGFLGTIPHGAIVTVELYRNDGAGTPSSRALVATKDFPIDTAAMNNGQLTFRATDDAFCLQEAGMAYWVATLKTANGAVLDRAIYGESGDQHGTGTASEERTSVQAFATTVSKRWLSTNNSRYATSTVQLFDTLEQTSWTRRSGDMTVVVGQTVPDTQVVFEVWQQGAGDVTTDTLITTTTAHQLPETPLSPESNTATSVSQRLKSDTLTVGTNWKPGTYYVRALITHPDVDRTVEGRQHVVTYTPAREATETFSLVDIASTSAEPLYSTDHERVQDTLVVTGTLPAQSRVSAQLWTTDDDGTCVQLVNEAASITLDHDVTDTTVDLPALDAPTEPGGYQWRVRVWTPDGLGGRPSEDDAFGIIDARWKQGGGYDGRELVFDGMNTPDEHFDMIGIATSASATTAGDSVVANGHAYVDVTHGAQVADHVTITGRIQEGYLLGFHLYRQDAGDNALMDELITAIDPVPLDAAIREFDSATVTLDQPGTYYWVTRFTKDDGTVWKPDGSTEVLSARRVSEETFQAVRITTTTAAWSATTATDTARIEGCLPKNSSIDFALYAYDTADLVARTGYVPLSDLGYVPCTNGSSSQTVTAPSVQVPQAGDYYFVERLRLPSSSSTDTVDFHTGDEHAPFESTRAISASTHTDTETFVGTAVSDHTDLAQISYDTHDIARDDLTEPLTIEWEVWQQSTSEGVDHDTLLDRIGAGTQLADGQTTADSPAYTFDEPGTYYFRVVVRDHTDAIVAYGQAREPAETIHVVDAMSSTEPVIAANTSVRDTVTITGPVLEGTIVTWLVMRQGSGDASTDTAIRWWDEEHGGAYRVTAQDAQQALETGSVEIISPLAYEGHTDETVYFVFSLTAPTRDSAGESDESARDNIQTGESSTAFYTDTARTPAETTHVVSVTTLASTQHTVVGETIHDTALIDGYLPDGYCIEFEYWQQHDGTDVARDQLISTSECVPVPAGASTVDSPEIKDTQAGTFYFRERLHKQPPQNRADDTELALISYGKPRVADETVHITPPALASTGTSSKWMFTAAVLCAGLALAVLAAGWRFGKRGAHAA